MTIPVRVLGRRGVVLIGLVTALAGPPGLAAEAGALPQYIAALVDGRLLSTPVIRSGVLTLKSTNRYLALTPESKDEVCRTLLEHHAAAPPQVRKVLIVNATGGTVTSCE